MDARNRHPVDQLSELRAERAAIDKRIAEIRDQILRGECDLAGADCTARLIPIRATTFRITRKAVRSIRLRCR
jgi:hypothetical protein